MRMSISGSESGYSQETPSVKGGQTQIGMPGIQCCQEPWTEASGELLDLLLAIAGWVARMESNRRSERTKAGLQRAVSQGKRLGRPPGSKDRKKRSRRGYFARWAE